MKIHRKSLFGANNYFVELKSDKIDPIWEVSDLQQVKESLINHLQHCKTSMRSHQKEIEKIEKTMELILEDIDDFKKLKELVT